ncbi:extracellular solute-binding protein [Aureimonas altamirensis]|uniref:sensor histidine kinase n=1 Tax=Aureimonas altamirensis TaxID=370622 RepID=UPI002036ADE6|nr:extracellular solute-binding protein [Aureimonas altamirensis]MCM2503396.1 extracellular solute-binding protein [Aureimonas altamirensis]
MAADGFSIRRRILWLAIALLLAAALALVVFVLDYARRSSDTAYDRLLSASAFTIAGAVQAEAGRVTVELPLASFAMFSDDDRVFYSVAGPDGGFVTGYPELGADLAPATDSEPDYDDIDFRGEPVRVATVGRLVSTASGTGWVTIRVAETKGERAVLAREILGNALLPIVAMTLLSIALVWFAIGRAFRPLTLLERNLNRRTPDDLSPVVEAVPVEVRRLVDALNDFIGRLRQTTERLGALVAEAAHEVRTPLASLRAQAEVALSENDPAMLRGRVQRIHQGAVQASHLVNQLLMDATVAHRLEARRIDPVQLGDVVGEVVGRLSPDLAERLDVDVPRAARELVIDMDRVVLREMLRNLIDNALIYAPGPVLVEAEADDGAAILSVIDHGPGIAPDERQAVTERFRRGSAAEGTSGSGLGLAIVARVAAAAGGRFLLDDTPGGGLTARVRLPARRAATALAALVVAAGLWGAPHPAQALETYPAPSGRPGEVLTILGTTDTPLFRSLVEGFQRVWPDVTVAYEEGETLPIYLEVAEARADPKPDLVMSSATDLQVKLANDGFAQAHEPPNLAALPRWAQWRREVFGFTFEPAVIVYNPDLVAEAEVPRTRIALAELLERFPERFSGKVATYDIAKSGVGYLLAAQDQTISSYFWRLASAFGHVDAQLSGSSPDILDRVERGELALGYNVLGSYALARQAAGHRIGVVVPDDYVLVLTRTLLIPEGAPRPDLARAFIDFALSAEGQSILAGEIALGAVIPGSSGAFTAERIAALGRGAVQPIALGPGLLVALDRQRRARFLETWLEIVGP